MQSKPRRLIDANALDLSFDRRYFSEGDECYVRGDDGPLQCIAGHGDFKITMNRYVHGREGEVSAAGAKLSNLMGSAKIDRKLDGSTQNSNIAPVQKPLKNQFVQRSEA